MIKSLWASVQGDPVFMRRVNGWLTIFWIIMIPVSVATGWVNSVTYVSGLSLWLRTVAKRSAPVWSRKHEKILRWIIRPSGVGPSGSSGTTDD